ncbi:hypothetical protein AVEN_28590-1 [Araneus ventricosus]|uniref:Uncharacterized protein n=1 Tax=Araneus ventricosus TaxID=182803 RepID=A0A4Y2DDH7_ARAVE|nr:hypothetical protein AVEN_28590-1 [Araneus ventricosus]
MFPSKGVGKIVFINGKMTVSMYADILSQNLKKSITNFTERKDRLANEAITPPPTSLHLNQSFSAQNRSLDPDPITLIQTFQGITGVQQLLLTCTTKQYS